MFLATPKHILILHLVTFSLCLLTFFRSAEAGEGVVVERNTFPGADFDWSSPPADDTNKKSGSNHKRMERANAAGQGGYKLPPHDGLGTDGSEWGKRETDWTAPPVDDEDSYEWGKREHDWAAPPADDNDGNDWGKRAEDSYNGVCASCIKKRIADLIWPPALTKRAPIDPSKNQQCKYVIGADGPTDNIPGGCKPQKRSDNNIGPGDSHDWLLKRSSGVLPFQKPGPFAPSFNPTLKMNKRGLIEEWMHPHGMAKRQLCQDAGWQRCANNNGCCQSSANCCATVCKSDPTDICCPGYTCAAGAQCTVFLSTSSYPTSFLPAFL